MRLGSESMTPRSSDQRGFRPLIKADLMTTASSSPNLIALSLMPDSNPGSTLPLARVNRELHLQTATGDGAMVRGTPGLSGTDVVEKTGENGQDDPPPPLFPRSVTRPPPALQMQLNRTWVGLE